MSTRRIARLAGVSATTVSLALRNSPKILDGTDFSGLEANQHLLGAWAVELLVARIMNRDFGIPAYPCVEMVDCRWVDGKSLRSLPTDRAAPVG